MKNKTSKYDIKWVYVYLPLFSVGNPIVCGKFRLAAFFTEKNHEFKGFNI